MILNIEQACSLLDALRYTRDHELACDEWLAELPKFLEAQPDEQASDAFRLVREHLELCPECREEIALMLTALRQKGSP